MNIYKKLQAARIKLQQTELRKSGKNKFAGYEYFELSDFLPAIQRICNEVGLCGVVCYDEANAHLTIYDTDGEGTIVFSSPMSSAELKGCHPVQNLGAVQTYLRRYLYTAAFELVEHDALDATTGSTPVKPVVVPKVEAKVEKPIVGKEGEWQIKVPPRPEEDDIDSWLVLVEKTTEIALGMATKEEDVMQIFKKNKSLFDTVKGVDALSFKELMAKFTEAKNRFKEAA
jgi:hypothetical protein